MRRRLAQLLFIGALASPSLAHAQDGWGMYCRRHTGLAAGLVHAPGTWERIGKSPTFITASPVLAGSCALDIGPASFAAGTEAMFTYVHYNPDRTLSTGLLSFSLSATGGTDELRVGAHVFGTFNPIGAGVTLDWLPGRPNRTRDGLQARLTTFWVAEPAVQLMVLYTVAGPRIP